MQPFFPSLQSIRSNLKKLYVCLYLYFCFKKPVLYVNKNEFVGKTARAMALMKNETAMLLRSDGKPIRILTSLAITR